jgi:hypothetical protein
MGNLSHTTGNVGIGNALASTIPGVLTVTDTTNTTKAAFGINAANSLNFIQGGGDYMAIGYNLRHTGTNNTWNYAGNGNEFASLLRWQQGGFQFWGTSTQGAAPTAASLTNFLSIKNSGNVGIGTDNPTVKLDVNGVARFGAGTFPQIKKVEYIPTFTTNSVKDTDNFYFVVYGSGTTATLSTILSDFTNTAYTSTAAIAAAQNGGVAGTVGALKYSTKINPLTISITPRFNTSKLLVKFKVSCSEPHTVDATGTTSEGDCGFIITRSIDGGAETLVGIPAAAITSASTRGVFHSVIAVTVKENSANDDQCQTEIEYLDEDGAAQSWGGKTVTYSIRIYGKEGPGVATNTQRILLGRGKDDLDQGDDSRTLSYSIIQEYFE